MKTIKHIFVFLLFLFFLNSCSTVKRFLPSQKSNDDISYELIENLSTAFSDGKLQALEEMIAIYNDTNQPYDVRMAAGVALGLLDGMHAAELGEWLRIKSGKRRRPFRMGAAAIFRSATPANSPGALISGTPPADLEEAAEVEARAAVAPVASSEAPSTAAASARRASTIFLSTGEPSCRPS